MIWQKTQREPLIHLTKRAPMKALPALGIRAGAFLVALAASALFVYLTVRVDPWTFLRTMGRGAFGMPGMTSADSFDAFWSTLTSSYFWSTLKTSCKLLLIAVALAPAFKMRFWNIGAEGQVLAGGMGAAFIMFHYGSLPPYVLLPLMLVVSLLCGAVWGLIPAIFKAKLNTNETLFTLMMNYIAMKIVDYFFNLWRGPKSALGLINPGTQGGWLCSLWSGQESAWYRNEDLIFIVTILILAVLMFFYLKSTKHGYEIAVVGDSQNTAKYAGISVNKVVIRTMAISGAVCGLCGFLCVSSQSHTISSNLAGGYGFTAIIVAWLSKFSTFTMIGVSLLVIALENGAMLMANTYGDQGFSPAAAKIIVGLVLLLVIGCEFFINYRVVFRSKKAEKEAVAV
ncbi:MAG: ABC transporter permease [Clostridia bacterium]|nr:ABC transporter permease [Clostridia bacterium]